MIARVRLWGRTIGAVSLEEGRDFAAFQYDPDFAQSGIEVALIVGGRRPGVRGDLLVGREGTGKRHRKEA